MNISRFTPWHLSFRLFLCKEGIAAGFLLSNYLLTAKLEENKAEIPWIFASAKCCCLILFMLRFWCNTSPEIYPQWMVPLTFKCANMPGNKKKKKRLRFSLFVFIPALCRSTCQVWIVLLYDIAKEKRNTITCTVHTSMTSIHNWRRWLGVAMLLDRVKQFLRFTIADDQVETRHIYASRKNNVIKFLSHHKRLSKWFQLQWWRSWTSVGVVQGRIDDIIFRQQTTVIKNESIAPLLVRSISHHPYPEK